MPFMMGLKLRQAFSLLFVNVIACDCNKGVRTEGLCHGQQAGRAGASTPGLLLEMHTTGSCVVMSLESSFSPVQVCVVIETVLFVFCFAEYLWKPHIDMERQNNWPHWGKVFLTMANSF